MTDTSELPDKCPNCDLVETRPRLADSLQEWADADGACNRCGVVWWWRLLQEARRKIELYERFDGAAKRAIAEAGSDLVCPARTIDELAAERDAAIARADAAERQSSEELSDLVDVTAERDQARADVERLRELLREASMARDAGAVPGTDWAVQSDAALAETGGGDVSK